MNARQLEFARKLQGLLSEYKASIEVAEDEDDYYHPAIGMRFNIDIGVSSYGGDTFFIKDLEITEVNFNASQFTANSGPKESE